MQARELFEILAREHLPMLRVYLRCLVAAGEVDDLVQESLVAVWRALDRFDRSKPFGPWLRGIARNVALAHHRQSAQADLPYDPTWLLALEDRCAAVQNQPGDTLDEKLTGLRNCIEQLPEPYKTTIRYRYQFEIIGEALAQRLQINLENVKKRLQRGRQWLSECMGKKLETGEVPS
jgi:RNA polymerase sigma factor (sigma-70 family)